MKKRRYRRSISPLGYLFLLTCFALLVGFVFLIIFLFNKINNKDTPTTTTTEETTTIELIETVTIRFESNGGEPIDPITIEKGETIDIPEVKREGYIFIAWLDSTGKTIKAYDSFEEDVTFTASWEKNDVTTTTTKKVTTTTKAKTKKTLTINYDSKGGSKVKATTLTCTNNYATLKTLPKNPTKDGYKFISWLDKDNKAVKANTKFKCGVKSVTLTAKWTKSTTTTTTKKTTSKTTTSSTSTSSSTTSTTTTTTTTTTN